MREPDRVRQLLVGVDLALERVALAQLHQVDDAPVAALEHALAVARGLRGRDHLGRGVEPLLDPLRRPQRHPAGVERGRERGRVAGRARVLDRSRAQLLGAVAVGVVALDRQPRPQPRREGALVGGQQRQRLLERARERRVGGGDEHADAAAAERGAGEQPRVARVARELDDLAERGLRLRPAARAVVRGAEREQDLGPRVRRRRAASAAS